VAPGSRVVSAEAGGSYLARTYPERHVTGSGASGYMQMSGTSMSAGVVSGAVALLIEGKPKLSPRNTKAVLQMTSSFMPKALPFESGVGCINAFLATRVISFASKSPHKGTDVEVLGANEQISSASSETIKSLVRAARADRHDSTVAHVTKQSIVWDMQGNFIVWDVQATAIESGCTRVPLLGPEPEFDPPGCSRRLSIMGTFILTCRSARAKTFRISGRDQTELSITQCLEEDA
jgi:subtilase family protein